MPVNDTLVIDSLRPWVEDEIHKFVAARFEEHRKELLANPLKFGLDGLARAALFKKVPTDRGPVERAFLPMFSLRENEDSVTNNGFTMGADPHFDARQTILALAEMLDSKFTSRACVGIEGCYNTLGSLDIDIISLDGNNVWSLQDYPSEPIIFVRCACLPGETTREAEPFRFRMHRSLVKTKPKQGIQNIKCASQDEMDILLRLFNENAKKISPELKARIEAGVVKKLLDIPLSYTSFFTLLIREEKIAPKFCQVCGNISLKTCSKCKVARYCSKECQLIDWKSGGHRRTCRPPEEIAADAAASDLTGAVSVAADVADVGADVADLSEKELWIDIDPVAKVFPDKDKDGISMARIMTFTSHNESSHKAHARTMRNLKKPGGVLDEIKRDRMMMIKVQILNPGSRPEDHFGLLIYPQGKRFEIVGYPENTSGGFEGHASLHNLIKAKGTDSGLGKGGCKAYMDAYVTSEGKLRIMMNKINPLQTW